MYKQLLRLFNREICTLKHDWWFHVSRKDNEEITSYIDKLIKYLVWWGYGVDVRKYHEIYTPSYYKLSSNHYRDHVELSFYDVSGKRTGKSLTFIIGGDFKRLVAIVYSHHIFGYNESGWEIDHIKKTTSDIGRGCSNFSLPFEEALKNL